MRVDRQGRCRVHSKDPRQSRRLGLEGCVKSRCHSNCMKQAEVEPATIVSYTIDWDSALRPLQGGKELGPLES